MQIQKIDNSQSLKPMFKGQLGDKLIRNYTQGGELTSNVVIKEIKGFCGISKSKLVDVLDSFIAKLRKKK